MCVQKSHEKVWGTHDNHFPGFLLLVWDFVTESWPLDYGQKCFQALPIQHFHLYGLVLPFSSSMANLVAIYRRLWHRKMEGTWVLE